MAYFHGRLLLVLGSVIGEAKWTILFLWEGLCVGKFLTTGIPRNVAMMQGNTSEVHFNEMIQAVVSLGEVVLSAIYLVKL